MSGYRLIVGLGNPGSEYRHTRHNAGTWLVENWSERLGLRWNAEARVDGRLTRLQQANLDVRFLLPDTFMNHSGLSVLNTAHYFNILPQDILIVHDELDLPVGQLRLKIGGGHGGHNGLKSIIQALGQQNGFSRLRIGIGRPTGQKPVIDYVLGTPTPIERQQIDEVINNGLDSAGALLHGDTARFMNQIHT